MAQFPPPKPPTRDEALGVLYYLLDQVDNPPAGSGGGDPLPNLLTAVSVVARCVSVLPAAPPAAPPAPPAAPQAQAAHPRPR